MTQILKDGTEWEGARNSPCSIPVVQSTMLLVPLNIRGAPFSLLSQDSLDATAEREGEKSTVVRMHIQLGSRLRAVGNDHFCDTTQRASQRLTLHIEGEIPTCITEVVG